MKNAASLLRMGVCGRPHGIKGEIALTWDGEYIPKKGDTVLIGASADTLVPYEVLHSREHKGRLLLYLSGIADRTAAEKLNAQPVFMARDTLPQPKEDEAYLEDLPGSRVFLPDGEYLGKLIRIDFLAKLPVFVIHDAQNREILLPGHESVLKSLDGRAHTITVEPPPGLLEIYRA